MTIIKKTLQQVLPKIGFCIVALGCMLLPIFTILLIEFSLVNTVIGIFVLVAFCIIYSSFLLTFTSFAPLCKKSIIFDSGTGKSIFTSPENYESIYTSKNLGVSTTDRVCNMGYSGYSENTYNPIHGFLGRRDWDVTSVENSHMPNNIHYYSRNNNEW